jgi:alkaline phosphatase D
VSDHPFQEETPVSRAPITRRSFVAGTAALAALGPDSPAADDPPARQATGTRVGEVTADSAVVWTRLTAHPTRNADGVTVAKQDKGKGVPVPVEQLEGACPGAAGRVRVRYSTREDLGDATATDWAEVGEAADFIHQFRLTGLRPATTYHYAAETTGPGGAPAHGAFRGRFGTAPAADAPAAVRFCVMTCQGYPDRGHPDGHPIYPAMLALEPRFAVLTGDLVYYDNDPPSAVTPRLARYHWERMFSLPRLVAFTRGVGTYWLKDDHDTLDNDTWPGRKAGELTFAAGQKIFRQQAPLADGPSYRTFRWGRDLQLWFTDGRDHRSPNNQPDGPGKTIWGAEQKAWFKRTVRESTATWKVLVSPTPLVGPDRKGKNDNHSNAGFAHEGDEVRGWLRENVPDNVFVACGDRHWQYHSVHPQTGLHEFSVGPASDEHAGGTPGEDKAYHRFHRVKGGFLSVDVGPKGIAFRHHDVRGAVVYECEFRPK